MPSEAFSPLQVVHEIRNYPYPQLHFLALQGLNPSRHTSAVRESYEVRPAALSGGTLPLRLVPAGLVETPPSPVPPSLVGEARVVAGSLWVASRREKKRSDLGRTLSLGQVSWFCPCESLLTSPGAPCLVVCVSVCLHVWSARIHTFSLCRSCCSSRTGWET